MVTKLFSADEMHLANKPKFILKKKKLNCVESGQDYVSPRKSFHFKWF